jgi:hypothetical protein
VESFFARQKGIIRHAPRTLLEAALSVRILAEMAVNKNRVARFPPLPQTLMTQKDQLQIGSFAGLTIAAEWKRLEIESQEEMQNTQHRVPCCPTAANHQLPCFHLLAKRIDDNCFPLITLDDIPLKHRREHFEIPQGKHQIERRTKAEKIQDTQWSFSEILARFEPFLSLASRDKRIQEILEKAEKELIETRPSQPQKKSKGKAQMNQTEKREQANIDDPEIRDPARMNTPGQVNGFHSKHASLLGRQKIKKTYRCSNCGGSGHNAASCRWPKKTDAPK